MEPQPTWANEQVKVAKTCNQVGAFRLLANLGSRKYSLVAAGDISLVATGGISIRCEAPRSILNAISSRIDLSMTSNFVLDPLVPIGSDSQCVLATTDVLLFPQERCHLPQKIWWLSLKAVSKHMHVKVWMPPSHPAPLIIHIFDVGKWAYQNNKNLHTCCACSHDRLGQMSKSKLGTP